MKKINLIMLLLTVLLCGMVTGCSKEEALVLDDVIPDNITSVEISGFYGGSELKLRELTQEEIEELNTWEPKPPKQKETRVFYGITKSWEYAYPKDLQKKIKNITLYI